MRVVIKIGTSTLAHSTGHLNIKRVEELCKIIADIKNAGNEIILVSSGAIGMGVGKLSLTEEKEPKILCDSVWEAPKPGAPMPGISPAFRPKRAADSQPDSAAALRERAEQPPVHTAKYGLYLKFPSRQ